MGDYLTPAWALRETQAEMSEPVDLGGKESHKAIVDRYARVVVRDSLYRLGIPFDVAEWYASNTKGCVNRRWAVCRRKLSRELKQARDKRRREKVIRDHRE